MTYTDLKGQTRTIIISDNDGAKTVTKYFKLVFCTLLLQFSYQSPTIAGELAPPGPPGPTFKTLGEIEPRQIVKANTEVIEAIVISQPGSYVLVEDVTAIPDNDAITITANNVSLDLNGFTVSGNLEVNDGNGIVVSGDNVTIRDGNVQFTDGDGIKCQSAAFLTLINVNSNRNTGNGVLCSEMHVIRGNFSFNGGSGVSGSFNKVEGARASENGLHGFNFAAGSSLSNGTAYANKTHGVNCSNSSTLVTQTIATNNGFLNIDGICTIFDSLSP